LKLALFLTLFRMVLSPLFIAIYLYYPKMGIAISHLPYYLLSLLIVCELTDIFDGQAARKFGGVTELGKILDPMADSIMRTSILVTFTQGVIQLPVLLILVFIYRDSMISTLRTLCALKGTVLAARKSGKIKAVIQAIVIFLIVILMIPYSKGLISLKLLQQISFISVLIAAIYTLASGVEYVLSNREAIKKAWVKKKS